MSITYYAPDEMGEMQPDGTWVCTDYCWVRREDYDALKEKALAAVNAPYEDILDMGLAQALRELEEALPPQ